MLLAMLLAMLAVWLHGGQCRSFVQSVNLLVQTEISIISIMLIILIRMDCIEIRYRCSWSPEDENEFPDLCYYDIDID